MIEYAILKYLTLNPQAIALLGACVWTALQVGALEVSFGLGPCLGWMGFCIRGGRKYGVLRGFCID